MIHLKKLNLLNHKGLQKINDFGNDSSGGNEPYVESDGVAFVQLKNESYIQCRRIKIKFQFTEIPSKYGYGGVCGFRQFTQYSSQRYGIIKTDTTLDFCAGSGNSAKREELPLNTQKQELDLITPVGIYLTINSNFIAFGMKSLNYPSGQNFYLSKVKIFYIEFYQHPGDTTLMMSFKPRVVNNEVGLYEEINDVFCPNIAGSGQLTYGLG